LVSWAGVNVIVITEVENFISDIKLFSTAKAGRINNTSHVNFKVYSIECFCPATDKNIRDMNISNPSFAK
jgi:hypothetical protein